VLHGTFFSVLIVAETLPDVQFIVPPRKSVRVAALVPISALSLTQPCPLCNIVEWTLVRYTDTSHDHCQPFESSITTRLPGCGRRYETTGTADTTGI